MISLSFNCPSLGQVFFPSLRCMLFLTFAHTDFVECSLFSGSSSGWRGRSLGSSDVFRADRQALLPAGPENSTTFFCVFLCVFFRKQGQDSGRWIHQLIEADILIAFAKAGLRLCFQTLH